ncbi:Mor transcription activator family protein [Acidovorax sp. GW101-3H11]|uniref:Mor transcription activator family protein n=1 Tax=Acidovorax sp. GW101-3H11 TaxID=1813946 RepID=UPI0009EEADA2|nr:Mor transcription activator family protein [Acidovorax sp. GW101-3H11]
MVDMFERMDIAAMPPAQIQPLEALIPPGWPDTWRELATSHYVTLVSAPGAETVETASLASLAIALTLGIAQDLGGTQPYIPVGAEVMSSARARRVVELLKQGQGYRQVADTTGLTESRVRQIESEWRKQQMALRQGQLQLD